MASFTRLFDSLYYQLEKYPQADSLAYKYDGNWRRYSTQEVVDISKKASLAFMSLGLKPGDKVALISPNRPEWNFIDLGLLQAGLVNVPVYPTISEADYNFIFNDAEIQYAFVADTDLFRKIKNIQPNCPSLKEIYSFDKVEGCKGFEEFLNLSTGAKEEDLKAIMDTVKPEELATIIYTSGTTGVPKGVMLSHNNVVSNVKSVHEILPINNSNRVLSFLPLCHIFERVVIYTYLYVGASVYYAESLEKLRDNISEVRPHYFSCVPRLLEKVYDGIVTRAMSGSSIKKAIFNWAMNMGLQYTGGPRKGLAWSIADKLVYSKVREAMGGEIIGIVTGAAALQERLCRVFNAMGIIVREGYGQTESSPVITLNRFEEGGYKFGTIGVPIPGVEVKLDPKTGEILAKGPNVMMGYYKRPDLTAQTIDAEGWLHTGDVGEMVDGKYIKITDRLKELFKTSGGKYVAPQVVENKMKESRYIEQICVLGENERFVSALIVPSFLNLEDWAKRNNVSYTSQSDLIEKPEVIALIKRDVEQLNQEFGKIEQVKKFKLLANEWSIDSGELTPTMKVKRKVINQKYDKEIKDLYASDTLV